MKDIFLPVFAAIVLIGCGLQPDPCEDRVMSSAESGVGPPLLLIERNCGATADYAYHLRRAGDDESLLIYGTRGNPSIQITTNRDGRGVIDSEEPIRVFENTGNFVISNKAAS